MMSCPSDVDKTPTFHKYSALKMDAQLGFSAASWTVWEDASGTSYQPAAGVLSAPLEQVMRP